MTKDSTKRKATARRASLQREIFRTSRLLDFLSEKELTAQIGHSRTAWPLSLVKELLDNSLDACEEFGIAPQVTISVDEQGLTVTDNGPGIPPDVVSDILDYSVRVSSREAYIGPSRGAQGNALKTVVAMPFVLDGERGRVTIRTRGIRHEITLSVDRIRQQPDIEHERQTDHFVKNGTSITVHLASSFFGGGGESVQIDEDDDDDLASSQSPDTKVRFLQFADNFLHLNPHLSLVVDWYGKRLLSVAATDSTWKKWKPSDPTSAHWYGRAHFERLAAAHLAHGTYDTVRELVAEFRGLTGTAKQKSVLAATGLHRAPLSALVNGDGKSLNGKIISKLLGAMQKHSKPVKPQSLGIIGRDHIATKFAVMGCEMGSFDYRKLAGETNGILWVVEAAFAWRPKNEQRRIITGVNWSPAIINPFRELGAFGDSLDSILQEQRAGADAPIVLLLHLACPRVAFADRGKSTVVVEGNASEIISAVEAVSKKWAKQCKAEERAAGARARRRQAMTRRARETLKDIVARHIEDAYQAVSDNGRLPAHARQIMYDVRRRIQGETDEQLQDSYFTQNLLPSYMREHGDISAGWDVVFDSRGHFTEPHTRAEVALGTLDVRAYLSRQAAADAISFRADALFPTQGAQHRFGAILFVEKEGFMPLFRATRLAERYDLGVMSTKGLSNIAARKLVDEICGEHEIPLLVLRDFDKAGFSIVGTLQRDSARYEFRHDIEVVDLGLRLADVNKWDLVPERFFAKASTASQRQNLRRNGATPDEIDFIAGRQQRVELNAFRSADLIAFIEAKLAEHKITKVIPDAATLEAAYRRGIRLEHIRRHFDFLKHEADEKACAAKVPALKARVAKAIRERPELPWDRVIAGLVADATDLS